MTGYAVDSNGQPVIFDEFAAMHTVMSGQTRSGKSVTSYMILAELASKPHVKIGGVDPSGILLAPFLERDPNAVIHLGTNDPDRMIAKAEGFVTLMDSRNEALALAGLDKIPDEAFNPELPIYVFVSEEYAGILAWLESVDMARKPLERLKPRLVNAVGRLLREGAKSGFRVFTILQRPEASTLHDRAQYSRRITHRLDNTDSVRMILEAASPEQVEKIMDLPPGVGVIHEAGEEYRFFRTAYLDYPIYRQAVLAARN